MPLRCPSTHGLTAAAALFLLAAATVPGIRGTDDGISTDGAAQEP